MAVQLKPNAITEIGGNQIALLELNPTTLAALTPVTGSTAFNLGYLESSDVNQTTTKTTFKAEDGEVVLNSFEYERMTTGNLMQSDKDLIDFLGHTVKGKVYMEGKYTGVVNSLFQWIFKPGTVTPQYSVKRPGGSNSMAYEFTGMKVSSNITISAADMSTWGTTLSLSNFPTTTLTVTTSGFAVVEV